MTTKEQCDAIIAELHKRYGGDKKRLESLQRMTYMDRDIDQAFLVKNCKAAYGKSCTQMLTDEGILRVPYVIDDKLLNPVNCLCTSNGKKIRAKYQPRRMLGNIGTEIDAIQNGGAAWDTSSIQAPVMAVSDSVAAYFDNVVDPIANDIERLRAGSCWKENVESADHEDGLNKLKAFVGLCLKFTKPEMIEQVLPLAATKADGTLYILKKAYIAWSGVTINADVLALVLHNVTDTGVELKIERISSYGKTYQKLKAAPTAAEYGK
ncbi:MAG TPA: hypothetical protein P5116_01410 [Eubacteriales bacterium]|nr:hypothetical protein [Eubacteriales bacterium]